MIFKHFKQEQIDTWLDGNFSGLRQWLMTRHIARCPQCQKLREACEANRELLEKFRRDARELESIVNALPATQVVAPSLTKKEK